MSLGEQAPTAHTWEFSKSFSLQSLAFFLQEIDIVQVRNSFCSDVLAGNSAPSGVELLRQAQLLPSAETLPGYHYTAAENILFKNVG